MKARRILPWLAALVLCALPLGAQTQKSRASLNSDIDTAFADLGAVAITPADVRNALKDIVASSYNPLTDGSLATIYQPLDSDLTSIAALSTATYGRSLLTLANAAAGRTSLGLVPGTDVQAYSSVLSTYAGISPSANVQSLLGAADYSAMRTLLVLVPGTDVQAYSSVLATYAGISPSANVQTLLGAASYSAFRSSLGVAIGSDVQAYSSVLATYAGINPSANVQTLLGAASFSAFRTSLGVAIGTDVQAYDADLAALAALSSTGIPARTASNTWVVRTLTGTTGQISISDGDGVSANPTISLPSALTGINSITSASGQNWVAATGTFGTALTLASANGLATFAGEAQFGNTKSIRFADAAGNLADSQLFVGSDDLFNFYVNGATRAVIDTQGFIGVNITNPTHLLHLSSTGITSIGLESTNTASVSGPLFRGMRSRGTHASPADVANGDLTGGLVGQAYSGGTFFNGAEIDYLIDGTFTSGQRPPSRIEFYTNLANTGQTLAAKITSAGQFNVVTTTASTSATTGALVVAGGAGFAGPTFFGADSATATTAINIAPTITNSTGTNVLLRLAPTYNQTSTAAATDFRINRTETAVGSGAQLLADFQVGSVSKWKVDNAGNITAAGTITLGSTASVRTNSLLGATTAYADRAAIVGNAPVPLTESAGAVTIDWSAGNNFTLTLNANLTTVTFSNVTDGQFITIAITNTASNYTVALGNSIKWSGGSQPVQTIGAKTDVWSVQKFGSTYYGSVVQNIN